MIPSRWTALVLLGIGYAIALVYGYLDTRALAPILLLLLAGFAVQPSRSSGIRWLGHALFLVTGLGLALHWLPGFNNAQLMPTSRSSPNAPPFTTYLNLDKPLIGLWIVLACPWIFQPISWRRVLKVALIATLLTSSLCLALACIMGITAWTPKWPPYALLWLANNLLLVVLAEELLFRGYIQGALQRYCHHRVLGGILPVGITALLFGLAHIGAGWAWVLLASLAGVGYGLAWRYGGLWAAVIAHLGLNLAHFCLFAYPILAK